MRVVLLITDLERGGTPLRIARLARRLRAAGIDAYVGCLAPPGPVSRMLDESGVPTFACGAHSNRDVPALKRLLAHVRAIAPDLIHANLTHANVAARLVGRWLRIPVIGSTTTIEVERRSHRVFERLTGRWDCAHIVHSEAVAEHVVRCYRLPRDRVHVVPASLDPPPARVPRAQARAACQVAADRFVVAWVGRFDPVKRLDLLVRAAGQMSEPWAQFLLAGDGPERRRIERLVWESRAGDRVRLLGWRDDVATVLSAADAFVLPSRTEGMPNALLEAMSLGLPIVASDIPVHRELSGNGDRFDLVRGDDPGDYARALWRLRDDEARRSALGRRARAWAEANLDPAAAARAVAAIYERVLQAAGVRAD